LPSISEYPTYRGTEEVVYLSYEDEWLGLRPADGGTHRYYGVGLEHLAFEVDTSEEVDAAYERCSRRGDRIHYPPEEDSDIPGYYAFFVFDPDGLRIEVFCPGAGMVLAHPQVQIAARTFAPTAALAVEQPGG
jgi:catechol 2,3-dioxygenase-like lactoylglutathione lyase family enzyme